MTLIKICGLSRPVDLETAADAGADAVGFVFYGRSHRYVLPARVAELLAPFGSRRPFVTVGVFVDEPLADVREIAGVAGLDFVQLCGGETADYARAVGRPVIRALQIREPSDLDRLEPFRDVAEYALLDAYRQGLYGGTGHTFDWDLARPALSAHRVILAGGLTPENVGAAIGGLEPYGVDVSSGVESDKLKDPTKIRAFIARARAASRARAATTKGMDSR